MRHESKMYLDEEIKIVVLDFGEYQIKAGFAREAQPRGVYESQAWSLNRKLFSDEEWFNFVNQSLRHVYLHVLHITPSDCALLICENPLWPYAFKRALIQVILSLTISYVSFMPASIFPLLATGTRTGTVIDIGLTKTCIVPVFEGYPMLSYMCVLPIGSSHVCRQFESALSEACTENGDAKKWERLRSSATHGALERLYTTSLVAQLDDSSESNTIEVKFSNETISIPGTPSQIFLLFIGNTTPAFHIFSRHLQYFINVGLFVCYLCLSSL
jgi:actin-related protein